MNRLLALFIVLISLVGCASEEKASGRNIACAFVEGYFDTKALIMTRPSSEAVEMAQGLTPTPEEISSSFELDGQSRNILVRLRGAIVDWALAFQDYSVTNDKVDFAVAGKVLEDEIDILANQCSQLGWKFPVDWIHNDL